MIKDRADRALRAANIDRESLADLIADREQSLLGLRAELALLQLALEQIKSAVWATDDKLMLYMVANGEMPTMHGGVYWEAGKTVYQIFKSEDPEYPPIAAHLKALNGEETALRLEDEFKNMLLRAIPLKEESSEIIGCIGIMNYVGE